MDATQLLRPFPWLRKAWLILRELRTHEQEILSRRDLLVRELFHNARLLEEYEHGKLAGLGVLQVSLQFTEWRTHAAHWSALRRSNQELWQEIAGVYDAMTS